MLRVRPDPTKPRPVQVTVRIAPVTWKAVKVQAVQEGRTLQAILEELLTSYIGPHTRGRR